MSTAKKKQVEIQNRHKKNKFRVDRQTGINVSGSPRSPLFKRSMKRPGQHGDNKNRRISEHSKNLTERAKLLKMFALRSYSLSKLVGRALSSGGKKDDMLAKQLTSRLDNIVSDAKFAISIEASGQLISHGKITVNGKKVDIRSYQTKIGDVISLTDDMKENTHVKKAVETSIKQVPEYLRVTGFDCEILSFPNAEDRKFKRISLDFNAIIESK
jgi:small subunit ribosomal protein S4